MQNISDSNSENRENTNGEREGEKPNKWLLAREMADAIIQYAKTNNCVVLVESHVKKISQLRKTRLKS